ncbi:MAG: dihydroorotate dehydrogenase electron transfer subunit [Lachnospiraceae bacterium]|nr:dihydroorotate dehydrogenase electron transfer subunit [Lachnospiraceae bacterium]
MKKKTVGFVIKNEEIATDIFSMWINTEIAAFAMPGQFVGVYTNDRSALLPRPISVCEVNKERNALRLVYRVVGKGTGEFSHLQSGRRIMLLGMLGNGYPTSAAKGKHAILMGGGIGIPPIVELAKSLSGCGGYVAKTADRVSIILGFRDAETFLVEELEQYGKVYIATDDGSLGTKGNVIDAMKAEDINPDIIYACGPMPMLRGIKHTAEERGICAYISLEERMACGVGACLGCVCTTTSKNSHSHVNNARICTDGPVFDSREVVI